MGPVAELLPPALARLPARRVDFGRPRFCLLGLPFDAIGMADAVEQVRTDAFANRRCWISTPNLNFVVAALADPTFRDSVLQSDLSLVDGMPLVWAARAIGLPLRERLAGSDLFEALQAHGGEPLTVYLFGGPPGAARLAADRMTARGGGLRCVGFDEAGFGSVESMSEPATIARINASGAHFVVVAMGAKKGQAWIARNADRLAAPVLCHLGAVMNFAAGTLRRAPPWARRTGLEWLWRIAGEPGLWRRYAGDGAHAARLLATSVIPDALAVRLRRRDGRAAAPLTAERRADVIVLRPADASSPAAGQALAAALAGCIDADLPLCIDLGAVDGVGHAFAALLLVAKGWFASRGGFAVGHANVRARADLRRMLAARALDLD